VPDDFGVRGADALAPALAVHTQLARLRLGGNAFGSAGVLRIAAHIVQHSAQPRIELGNYEVAPGAMCAIAAKLIRLPSLGHLDLGAEVAGSMGGVGVLPMAADAEAGGWLRR
jgi:hypothetical protein